MSTRVKLGYIANELDGRPDDWSSCLNKETGEVMRLSPEAKDEELTEKQRYYRSLTESVAALLKGETDFIANTANVSALLYAELPDVNWAGFYLLKGNDLFLGPFQGKPACTRIALGKGVCGTAAEKRESVVVENVKKFPGYIACDRATKSEIVVPLIKAERLVGVLDVDSAMPARFDDEDRSALEEIVRLLLDFSND